MVKLNISICEVLQLMVFESVCICVFQPKIELISEICDHLFRIGIVYLSLAFLALLFSLSLCVCAHWIPTGKVFLCQQSTI